MVRPVCDPQCLKSAETFYIDALTIKDPEVGGNWSLPLLNFKKYSNYINETKQTQKEVINSDLTYIFE